MVDRLPLPPLSATGVGSLPHRDPRAALRFVARTAPGLPYRPELVKLGDRLGGAPAGRAAFLDAVKAGLFPAARAVKGQVCGPLTASLVRGVPLPEALDGALREAADEARALVGTGLPALVVVDEPCLGGLRAADRGAVVRAIRQLFSVLDSEGAIAGLHCCDAMDLSLLVELQPAVWSFDAFAGLEVALADPSVRHWLSAGGRPMFGLVPTRGSLRGLRRRLGAIPGELRARSLLSPSCGLGTLTRGRALRVAGACLDLSVQGLQE